MKKITAFILILLASTTVLPQTKLTLDECYTKARNNYPLIKQKEYIARSGEFSVSNVWKNYLPQITISGQATYQSDVTALPISLPGIKIDPLSKDQSKVVADVSQTIWDGGVMSAQAGIQKAGAEAEDQKIEIELLKVKDRINQIYFGILLIDEQLLQNELVKRDLNTSMVKLKGAYEYGTATSTNVDLLKAELLKADQRLIELKSSKKSYIEMLGMLINEPLDESLHLEIPAAQNYSGITGINRPELKLYSSQKNVIESQNTLAVSKILPKASLFFQGGYGKPTLNMLKNNFDWFYVAGAKLSWSLSNLYTYQNESEIVELNRKSVDAQRETFLLNTNLSLKQQLNEIEKLEELIKIDKNLMEIRTSVKNAALAQLENGVITSSDFIRELNAEDQARKNLSIHAIQLLLVQQNYKLTSGN
ncbi:MAG: transporter [Ignavibacteriae bacterium HGW-Ignavibacteriae-3]|nr:MAG: transporter [Ignavibacteriae bacterium HGW-Ignavibacteriae-3]